MNKKLVIILSILLIIWSIFDARVHIVIGMAEALRITGNILSIAVAVYLLFKKTNKYSPYALFSLVILLTILNSIHSSLHGYMIPMLVFVGVALLLVLILLKEELLESKLIDKYPWVTYGRKWWFIVGLLLLTTIIIILSGPFTRPNFQNQLHNGELVDADYWSLEPKILSAGMGFDNIIGIPDDSKQTVIDAGGSWYSSIVCTNGEEPSLGNRTSSALSNQVSMFYKGYSEYDDGLPVVFSWPVATETVDITDFKFTLNTGDILYANSVGMWPNWELNERNTVVLFGDFGNRYPSDHPDVIFPVKLEIVEDDTPLLLIGPDGIEFNAVGLTWTTDTTPYDSGPVLVGAKLNHIIDSTAGEGGLNLIDQVFINDEHALYDEGDFRLRILTSGGFSPDGVTPLTPDRYEDFFRILVTGEDGETVYLEEVGVDYQVAGGTLRVVGLSDLGQPENPADGIYYDGCYTEDRDNYIDIILVGDEAAARNIQYVEIPGLEGGYSAFYNPGGPGPEPTPGVTYTAPGPADLEPVIIALDDPWRVSRDPQ